MPSINLKEPTTIEALNDLLQSRLSDRCSAEIENNRLQLVESKAKGCVLSLRSRNGETICSVSGFMPSGVLRAALLVGIMIALSLATSLILGEFNIIVGGAIPLVIAYFSMVAPSRGLVADITAIIGNDLGQTTPPWLQLSLWWPTAGIAVCTVLLIGTLAGINSRAPEPAAVVAEAQPSWDTLDAYMRSIIISDYQRRYEDGRVSLDVIEAAWPEVGQILTERGVIGDPSEISTWSVTELCLRREQAEVWSELQRRDLFSKQDLQRIRDRNVSVGMTEEAMLCSWGGPQDVNRTVGSFGERKQNIYVGTSNRVFVNTENGIVTGSNHQ